MIFTPTRNGLDHLETLKMGQTNSPETLGSDQKMTLGKNLKTFIQCYTCSKNIYTVGSCAESCDLRENVFETERKRVELRVLFFLS